MQPFQFTINPFYSHQIATSPDDTAYLQENMLQEQESISLMKLVVLNKNKKAALSEAKKGIKRKFEDESNREVSRLEAIMTRSAPYYVGIGRIIVTVTLFKICFYYNVKSRKRCSRKGKKSFHGIYDETGALIFIFCQNHADDHLHTAEQRDEMHLLLNKSLRAFRAIYPPQEPYEDELDAAPATAAAPVPVLTSSAAPAQASFRAPASARAPAPVRVSSAPDIRAAPARAAAPVRLSSASDARAPVPAPVVRTPALVPAPAVAHVPRDYTGHKMALLPASSDEEDGDDSNDMDVDPSEVDEDPAAAFFPSEEEDGANSDDMDFDLSEALSAPAPAKLPAAVPRSPSTSEGIGAMFDQLDLKAA